MKIKIVVGFLVSIAAYSCGKANKAADSAPAPGSPSVEPTSEQQNFAEIEAKPFSSVTLKSLFVQSPASGVSSFAAFYSNGAYASGVMLKVGKNVYQAMGSAGHYTQNAGKILPSATTVSCPSLHPAGDVFGSDGDNFITVQVGATSTVLVKSQPIGDANGVVVQWGCFDSKTGSFTANPWTRIKP